MTTEQAPARPGDPDTVALPVARPNPVFVDGTGRRRRLARRFGYGIGGCGLVYGVLVGISLAGGPINPAAVLPFPAFIEWPRPAPSQSASGSGRADDQQRAAQPNAPVPGALVGGVPGPGPGAAAGAPGGPGGRPSVVAGVAVSPTGSVSMGPAPLPRQSSAGPVPVPTVESTLSPPNPPDGLPPESQVPTPTPGESPTEPDPGPAPDVEPPGPEGEPLSRDDDPPNVDPPAPDGPRPVPIDPVARDGGPTPEAGAGTADG